MLLLFFFPLAACGSVHSYLLLLAVEVEVVDLMRWTVGRSVVDLTGTAVLLKSRL
jgi:hypothetical protein